MLEDPTVILQKWPESLRLKEALSSGSFGHCYTMPGLKLNGPLPDLIANTDRKLGGMFKAPSTPKDLDSVHLLIADGHFRAAVNLTAELLTQINQGFGMAGQPSSNTDYSLRIWACRLQLLMALKLYTLLNDELVSFEELDAPDLFYQYYPNLYPHNSQGSLVLFSMRLIHAEALRFTSSPWSAIERIDRLEKNVTEVLDNALDKSEYFTKIWNDRLLAVRKMRARSLFFLKEYTTSMILYNRLSNTKELECEQRTVLKMMLMRMALIVGDEKKLEHYSHDMGPVDLNNQVAYGSVSTIWGLNNKDLSLKYHQNLFFLFHNFQLYNNMAICLLYKGQVADAIELLKNSSDDLIEPAMINLSTVGELSVSNFDAQNLIIFYQKFERVPDMFHALTIKN
ncbi:unnamed protein product [Thelazia callipaeda]|uniref:Tetratricopeptide repeat protein 15 n=1 Tax=Thelazia callipaeda TaxID=103827 RepID=A0A0N5D9E1_THECL|nr:unnamed protein product [Thelazia callipaeda]